MKTFSLVHVAPALFACLVGCGGGAAASAPPPAAPSPPPVAAAPAAVAAPAPPPAAFTTAATTDSATPDVPPMTSSGATLTWYGHAAFKLVTPSGKVIWFDPWITNPKNPTGKDDLAKIDKADLILVSHGHFDHVGDAVAIGKKTHAKLVTTFDLGRAIVAYGGYPKDGAGFDSQGNVGGDISFFNGEVTVSFVPAVHSSSFSAQDAKGNSFGDLRPGGEPGGFVVTLKGGPVIYHTGDTDLFGDMALVGKYHKVNVMLACIGDHFTMGPERAAEAAVKKKGLHTQVHTMKVHEEMKL